MELRQLEYALAVAEELHFGRAAARMHVTQQSVSEQVRRLERELGAPLFTRTSRRVALTSLGEAFLPEARRVVRAAAHALDAGRHAAQGQSGEVRLGYADSVSPALVRLASARLAERAPGARVAPEPLTTPDQLVALAEQRLDAGLGWTPALTADLTSLVVAREPLVVVLPADHPLAAGAAVPPARLSGLPLGVVPRAVNPALHDRIVGQLAGHGVRVVIQQEVASLDRMLPLVLAGTAIAITARSVAAARPVPGVTHRPFTEPGPAVDCHLVWRRDNGDPALGHLVAAVRELRDAGAFGPDG
ncbi:MAG TPA: LysR substrate-binding domain-containing protein [Pseudonocardia sp.]|nr:LysR substrate-binding domain-containing protein [Pseudonocardia sp.]